MLNAGAGSAGTVLNMTGHQRDVVKGQTIAAIINITLNIVLLPDFGIIGAATATTISMMVWNVILVKLLKNRVDLNSSVIMYKR